MDNSTTKLNVDVHTSVLQQDRYSPLGGMRLKGQKNTAPQHPGLPTQGKPMANAELIHNVSFASPFSIVA